MAGLLFAGFVFLAVAAFKRDGSLAWASGILCAAVMVIASG